MERQSGVPGSYAEGPDPNLVVVAYEIVELERPRREVNERRHSRIRAKNRKALLIQIGRTETVPVLHKIAATHSHPIGKIDIRISTSEFRNLQVPEADMPQSVRA